MLSIQEESDVFSGELGYNSKLFTAEAVASLYGHFQTLLAAFVAHPHQQISGLVLQSEQERHTLLETFNDTQSSGLIQSFISDALNQQAARTPKNTALVFGAQAFSYQEFNRRVNQLANYLQGMGVGPEVLVGVCLYRSEKLVMAVHAIVRAGGVYVPLDPDFPQQRLAYMIEDSGLQTVVCDQVTRDALPLSVSTHNLDELQLAGYSSVKPQINLCPTNLAYMIYTSGSTGYPKGTGNSHGAIANRLAWGQQAYALDAGDSVLHKTPFTFDVSVWELFWPFAHGATLVVAKPGGHMDAQYLHKLMATEAITTTHFVPSMLSIFLEDMTTPLPALRQVFSSGEALSVQLQQRFGQSLAGTALHNLYGPTETAVEVTSWTCDGDLPLHTVPIGNPIANIRTYILDRYQRPQPLGAPGQLYIAGVGLARGYQGKGALTAAVFVPNPLENARPGERLYATGDLARFINLPNTQRKTLEYLGRIDHQVKLRGLRVELGEISSALQNLPNIREAVALADGKGHKMRLRAFLLTHEGPTDEAAATQLIGEQLLQRLPAYMEPDLSFMETFPTTASGKLDRKALLRTPDTMSQDRLVLIPS